jgi:hypothetical protein
MKPASNGAKEVLMDWKQMREALDGKRFDQLTVDEKRFLYAYDCWCDGAEVVFVEEVIADKNMGLEVVDDFLKNIFGYTDETYL